MRVVERLVFKDKRPDLVTEPIIRHLIDLYDEEIAYLDEQLRRLFHWLERRKLLDDTMVVLAADHGEEFMEHGSVAHCRTVYDTETRTPLLIWLPGGRPLRLTSPVENLDIVPTILDYLAIEGPADMEGESLRSTIEGREASDALAHSLQSSLRSINDGRHKVIYDTADGTKEIFDLTADPGETRDLSSSPPPEASALELELTEWIRDKEQAVASRHGRGYDKRIERSLRALGYLQ